MGIILVAAEGALTTMDERGKAVGFSATKVKEGVGPVGVGKRVPETVPERAALEPRGEEAAEEAAAGAAGPLALLDEAAAT